MDWEQILWVTTQISIIALFGAATIMTLVFTWLGLMGIFAFNKGKKYAAYKAAQLEEMQENIKTSFTKNASRASSVAPFAGLAMGLFGLKRNKSIFDKIIEKIKK